jgi:iron complex outermembrane receptor protein
MKSGALWLSASALAFAWCGTAVAQTQPVAEDISQGDKAETQESSKDEIVVTAQRRNENLMTTAVSASVLSGNQLENKGVANVDGLQFAMPSVTVNNFGQGNNFNVRGIGKAEHNTQTTTGVITYRDGVPSFPGYFQQEPYYDVANIQVLRGPQGTIVGQNATGGAVFVNTNDPIIGGGYHGYVNVNYGNYNDAGAQGSLNIPVSDTLAVRVALFGERRDSFFNVTGPAGAKYTSNPGNLRMAAGRFSLLWKPNDRLSILSKTDFDYLDMGGYPAKPFNAAGDLFDVSFNSPQAARDKFLRSILKVDYELPGDIKLRLVSGFQTGNTMYRADLDGTAANVSTFYDTVTETQFTQEFNIISPDNRRFTWLVGAFGMWNTYFFPSPFSNFTIDVCPGLNFNGCQYQLKGRNPERSLAAFGQVGFEITPNVKLELGGRYTASRSTNYVDVQQYGTPISQTQTVKSDNFSYKATLGWKVSPDQYLYGFVATGFRPGGLNVPVNASTIAPFKPEEVTSYELGWKGNFADGKLRTTVTGFYNDYKNFQVIIGYPTFPTFGIELNVPDKTQIYGFEAEAELHLGGFSIDGGVNVLHSELGQFYAVDTRNPPAGTGADPILPCDPAAGPASAKCIDLKGQRQTYAPNVTFNVGAQYEAKLGNGDSITPRVNFGYVGSQWATLFEDAARGDLIEARRILNAQIAFQHKSWTLTAYGTNLTDQHYAAALNSGLYFAGTPRQYGVKLLKIF